jgi:hypothetical protein
MASLTWSQTRGCMTRADLPSKSWRRSERELRPCPVPLASMPAGDPLGQPASIPPKHEEKPRDAAYGSARFGPQSRYWRIRGAPPSGTRDPLWCHHGPSRWSADENSSAPHERISGRASRPSSRVSSKAPWRASRNRDSATPRGLLLAWDRGCPAAPLAASSHACSFGSAAVARVNAPASPRRRRNLLLVEQAKV